MESRVAVVWYHSARTDLVDELRFRKLKLAQQEELIPETSCVTCEQEAQEDLEPGPDTAAPLDLNVAITLVDSIITLEVSGIPVESIDQVLTWLGGAEAKAQIVEGITVEATRYKEQASKIDAGLKAVAKLVGE